ncbi:MAG: hypothetical protein JXK16_04375 [Thiotrichales bacterium]|nr:hypothetical protein [Thiotrichales bacterium]
MSHDPINEQKLKSLLNIEERNHTPAERTSMIIQGVNWLTLMQAMLILFVHKLPLAMLAMLQTLLQNRTTQSQKESK